MLSSLLHARQRLAQYYEEMNDLKTSAYFHEKCLETSRLTNDRRGEMSANHRLGLTYENMVNLSRRSIFDRLSIQREVCGGRDFILDGSISPLPPHGVQCYEPCTVYCIHGCVGDKTTTLSKNCTASRA